MDNADTAGTPPVERISVEHRRDGSGELVVRLDWSTLIVTAAAFAVGILVGVVID